MKKRQVAALTFALGLSPLAPMSVAAAESDASYESNRTQQYDRAAPMGATPAEPAPGRSMTMDQDNTTYSASPAAVEREYAVPMPRETIVVTPADDRALYDPRNPQRGQLIGRGLFNQTGPNDFGR